MSIALHGDQYEILINVRHDHRDGIECSIQESGMCLDFEGTGSFLAEWIKYCNRCLTPGLSV